MKHPENINRLAFIKIKNYESEDVVSQFQDSSLQLFEGKTYVLYLHLRIMVFQQRFSNYFAYKVFAASIVHLGIIATFQKFIQLRKDIIFGHYSIWCSSNSNPKSGVLYITICRE